MGRTIPGLPMHVYALGCTADMPSAEKSSPLFGMSTILHDVRHSHSESSNSSIGRKSSWELSAVSRSAQQTRALTHARALGCVCARACVCVRAHGTLQSGLRRPWHERAIACVVVLAALAAEGRFHLLVDLSDRCQLQRQDWVAPNTYCGAKLRFYHTHPNCASALRLVAAAAGATGTIADTAHPQAAISRSTNLTVGSVARRGSCRRSGARTQSGSRLAGRQARRHELALLCACGCHYRRYLSAVHTPLRRARPGPCRLSRLSHASPAAPRGPYA